MIIDLNSLMIGNKDVLSIDNQVMIPDDYLNNTSIKRLDDIYFKGDVKRISDSDYQITGILSGNMVLADDITLEDVFYPYQIEIDESFSEFNTDDDLQIIQNKLDITDFLWQNILVEVPLKVKKSENENLSLQGDGWRLVTEEELNHRNNSPLSELSEILKSGKE